MKLSNVKDKNQIIGKIFSQKFVHTPRTECDGDTKCDTYLNCDQKFIILDLKFEKSIYWIKILYNGNKVGWIGMSKHNVLYE